MDVVKEFLSEIENDAEPNILKYFIRIVRVIDKEEKTDYEKIEYFIGCLYRPLYDEWENAKEQCKNAESAQELNEYVLEWAKVERCVLQLLEAVAEACPIEWGNNWDYYLNNNCKLATKDPVYNVWVDAIQTIIAHGKEVGRKQSDFYKLVTPKNGYTKEEIVKALHDKIDTADCAVAVGRYLRKAVIDGFIDRPNEQKFKSEFRGVWASFGWKTIRRYLNPKEDNKNNSSIDEYGLFDANERGSAGWIALHF